MYLKKLEVKGFGKLKEITINLTEGMNIVYGSNESGKTSLQWFIKAILFGLKGGRTSREGILPPTKKFKPWSGADFNGSIEYCLSDGKAFRVCRNFENNSVRIYDSMFNEITNDFEISKERGALFAERHLGMNETCFEKTVFIKQMESRINDDGSGELMNRLINVTQTGFEDVSFKSAQEALKDALKIYVGNDKTSTRPLDKVISRLQQLMLLKSESVKKRDCRISAEKEMADTVSFRDNLQERKAALESARELIETAMVTEKNCKLKAEIEKVLERINNIEEELDILKRKSSDFQRTREELGIFSDYNENDLEDITMEFNKLMGLKCETGRLQGEIQNKRNNLNELETGLEPFTEYEMLDQREKDETLSIYKEYESLKKEYEKVNAEGMNEKIKAAEKKNKLIKYNLILSVILSVSLIAIGSVNMNDIKGFLCFAAAAAGIVTSLVLALSKSKAYKELFVILNEKKISFINFNNVNEEINNKKKILENTFERAGVGSIEDFMALKSQYEGKAQYIGILKTELAALEIRNATCQAEFNSLNDKIKNRLICVNIIGDDTTEINEEHINNFKNCLRRYVGLLPGINYTLQRIKDMTADLENTYKHASSLSGIDCISKDLITDFLSKLSMQIELDEQAIKESFFLLNGKFLNKGLTHSEIMTIEKKFKDHEPESVNIEFEYEYVKVSEELNGVLMQIKEYELMLKELSNDNLELQRIDEEIAELKAKKNHLEDINISLKLALQVLTEASTEIQKDFAPALNIKMSSIINKISSGRYNDLRADSNLTLKTISPETGNVINAAALSGGTVDQMYLAMRIAMADLISGRNETLPLIMDEVFSQYDDERTRETFELLDGISGERQVVFFTCKRREVEIGQKVLAGKANLINLN